MSKKKKGKRRGFVFGEYIAPETSLFERLLDIFKELLTHTSGDVDEALDWMRELDKEYELTNDDYTMDDFIQELIDKGYLKGEDDEDGDGFALTGKMEQEIRKRALEQIFGKMKRRGMGDHRTSYSGRGDEHSGEYREFRFGDALDRINPTESLRNAYVNHGLDSLNLTEDDLVVEESSYKSSNEYGIDDRYQSQHDPIRGRSYHASKEGGHGSGRAHHNKIPQRYTGHSCVWKRCLAHFDQGVTVSKK